MTTAVTHAYEIIRDLILKGEIQPGERLREEELTQITGVSRTPVREAIRRLETEGFAVILPNRGATVPEFSRADIDEIYGLRALLEGHAARRAATRITEDDLQELESLNAKMWEVSNRRLERGDATTQNANDSRLDLTELNQSFHKVILNASGNQRLAEFVNQLALVALSARTFARYDDSGERKSLESHDELIRALRSGHADWAEAVMRSHVHNARQFMTSEIGGYESPRAETASVQPSEGRK